MSNIPTKNLLADRPLLFVLLRRRLGPDWTWVGYKPETLFVIFPPPERYGGEEVVTAPICVVATAVSATLVSRCFAAVHHIIINM
jgi:hypothetical protein